MAQDIQVMYVDDDSAALDSTAKYISQLDENIEVLTEEEPEVALDRLGGHDIDCLVSDYKMPQMDGLDFLSAVRDECPGLPFIFYTANGSESVASEAISNDATDYVRKAVDNDDKELLVSRIRSSVSRYRERLSYRELFENAGVGMVVYETDTFECVEFNQAYCDLLGYSRETLQTLDKAELTIPEKGYTRERAIERFEEALEKGTADYEWPYDARGDELVWADVSLEVAEIRGEERILATVRDITERKERERELRWQNDMFNRAQQIADVGVWEADLLAEEGWWSEEVTRIFGLPDDYTPGPGHGTEFFHPKDRGRVEEAFERARKAGESYDMEVRLIDAHDEEKWVRLQGKPKRKDGAVVAVRGTIQDITERKEHEETLKKIKERLDLAVEGADLGVWDWDMETDLVTVNERWAEIVNLDVQTVEPTIDAWLETIHPEDIDDVRDGIDAHNADEIPYYDFEYRVETDDGEWKWVQTLGRVVEREDGEPLRAVGVHMNVDERKRYEQQLKKQRDNLETLNEMVRHDIRNDLQLVLTYLEVLDAQVDEESKEYLETALDSTHSAIDLTETARELAEAMLQADTERHPVRLREALNRQIENVQSTETNAIVRTDGTTPRVSVLANDMLESVFRNLLKNAVQHNDKEVPEVTVSTTERDGSVVIHVADNGPGVPDDQKESIFAKGERGLESEGTGIGLYLVETLVEQYQGDIWVEDREGTGEAESDQGAVFNVELETAEPTQKQTK